MQKFTRALTREIEVGGERLAVTFDAEGLSLRPVGSRREPHRLDWAAVARAATGAGEVADALVALRDGAAKARPVALARPAEGGSLIDTLGRLDVWLATHRPRYHAALRPGATAEQLEALQAALGRPLPEELRTWLGWHNGQREGFHGAFVEAFALLGTEGALGIARVAREEDIVEGWGADWVPILADEQGNAIVLDPSSPGRPLREVWRGNPAHAVSAKSLAEWAERLLGDFEANRYVEDPERGEVMRVGGE